MFPDAASHTLAVPSFDVVNILLPSGENSTVETADVWFSEN